MSEFVVVYNPADEYKDFKFDGHQYRLDIDGLTVIPRKALSYCLDQLGPFGVISIKQGEDKVRLNQRMLEAKAQWLDTMRTYYEKILMDGMAQASKRKQLGFDEQPTENERKAKAFLTKHGFMKKETGE